MSDWGFLATNNSGQILVSSETRNLHFIGKATLHETLRDTNGYGGVRHWKFRIPCTAVPMPFVSLSTADRYAVVAVRTSVAGYWDIEVIRSGTSTSVPEVYVFVDPRGITAAPDTNMGLQVLAADQTVAFDSRYRPLVVSGGINVAPPSNPLTVSPPSLSAKNCNSIGTAASNLGPNTTNTYSLSLGAAKPIMYFPSIAQAQRQFSFHESEDECDGFDCGVCIGYSRAYDWWSYYWAFYRGGVSLYGTTLQCGWIAVEYGCNWTYEVRGSLVGIGVGGDSGQGGTWPYSNETLNLASTPVIFSDGALYD
jgi:hypothetical protein